MATSKKAQENVKQTEPKRLRRMSVRDCSGASPKDIRKHAEDTPNIPVVTFAGKTTATKEGESDKGPWIAFLGTFAARNKEGVIFSSNKLHLPADAEELLVAALASSDGGVQFTFDVFVTEDETAATGYMYVSQPVGMEQLADEALQLLSRSSYAEEDAVALLPAPEKD